MDKRQARSSFVGQPILAAGGLQPASLVLDQFLKLPSTLPARREAAEKMCMLRERPVQGRRRPEGHGGPLGTGTITCPTKGQSRQRRRSTCNRPFCAAAILRTAALALLAGGGLLRAQQPAVFTDTVTQVHVIASVKNSKGELVGTLQKSDFKIFDNGAPQEIRVFERQSSQPLSIALLIDVSGSTAKDLKYETDSATKFLHALLSEGNLEDAVTLYSFDSDVKEVRPFTHNYASLDAALKYIHGSGGTSLYDAIYEAAIKLEDRVGRKVIVVISDGGNTTSNMDIQKCLKAAQFADAVIYPVVVVPITNDAGRNVSGEHSLIFMQQGTGGRTFFPGVGKELDQAFTDILAELRTQYFLGYYPKGVPLTKNPFHTLEVKVSQPDLRVQARNGYYGEAEAADSFPRGPAADTQTVRKKK
jgi:Ca-activated chloride channel family protein